MNRTMLALDARLYRGTSSGDSTYWTGLVDALFGVEHEFDIRLCGWASAPAEAPEAVRRAWIKISAPNSRLWSLVFWPRAMRALRPRLVHTQYSLPFGMPGTKLTTIHDVSFRIQPAWFSTKDRWLLDKGVASAARRANMIITVSETSRNEIVSAYPKARGKVRVAYNAGNPRLVNGDRKQGDYLLTVSTQWPRKNVQLAIDAVGLLPDDLPHRLVLAGKPSASLRLNDRVVQAGYTSESELANLYAGADLYLCPSFHEGFGIPMVEAFAAGCPVLSSSGGALPEIGEGSAEFMTTWQPEAWAAKIEALLRDSGKLAAMREAGLRRARDFSWEKCANQHLEIYREALR